LNKNAKNLNTIDQKIYLLGKERNYTNRNNLLMSFGFVIVISMY